MGNQIVGSLLFILGQIHSYNPSSSIEEPGKCLDRQFKRDRGERYRLIVNPFAEFDVMHSLLRHVVE